MGAMTPPSRKSCYNFRVISIDKVLDGDTIDVTIDLGFDLYKKERVRVAGVDTPENEHETLKRRHSELTPRIETKEKLDGAISGDDDLVIRTELLVVSASMVDFSDGYISEMQNFRLTNK